VKSLFSVFLGCAGAVLAQNPQAKQEPRAKQENAPPQPMSFFVTSVGLGKGADLGGLAGADQHCQMLAQAVGAGNRTWHAYLSIQAVNGQPAVNARDRIGQGPWYNQKGHPSRGCSQENLVSTGGAGRYYCFAVIP
jgi:hypothetical protein